MLKRMPWVREQASLQLQPHRGESDPLSIVTRAVEEYPSPSDEVDEVWCVFDVEAPTPHGNLTNALELAARNAINVALSNPCFELWLILHIELHSAYLTTASACKKRSLLDGSSGKEIGSFDYMGALDLAIENAKALDLKHIGDGTVSPEDNPSSTVFRLIESVGPKNN
jgi:hypothetical protein